MPSLSWIASLLLLASTSSGLPWYSQLLQPAHEQAILQSAESPYHHFSKKIKAVAVIGAGPAGIQYAAELKDSGFSVRLFESKSNPGGNWFYQEEEPLPETYPQPPPSRAAFVPDLGPSPKAPFTQRIYHEGQDGLSLRQRLLEHATPSSVWESLHANSASGITHFISSPLPKDAPWELSQWDLRRHVRAFASNHELNANDVDVNNITSYSTRVERVKKHGNQWYLTLRRLEYLPRTHQIEATWWTEHFDAIVIATGPSSAAVVPEIKGLSEWAAKNPSNVQHSRHYRRPERYANQTVLIVGASISGSEIARDLFPHAKHIITSVKDNNSTKRTIGRRLAFSRIPKGVENLGEIAEFAPLTSGSLISDGVIRLKNGTTLTGIDSVILATGYFYSWPFLPEFHNDTIHGNDDPETEVAPIITGDGRLRSLYLGTFYIDDPTLAVGGVRVWNVGPYSAAAVAKVWSGTARLPNRQRLWEEHRNLAQAAGGISSPQLHGVGFGAPITEFLFRKFVGWINQEALLYGGKQLDTYPREWREQWVHFAKVHWGPEFPISFQDFLDADEIGEVGLEKRKLIQDVVAALEDY